MVYCVVITMSSPGAGLSGVTKNNVLKPATLVGVAVGTGGTVAEAVGVVVKTGGTVAEAVGVAVKTGGTVAEAVGVGVMTDEYNWVAKLIQTALLADSIW